MVLLSCCIYQHYAHLSNKSGGWNKRGGGAKFAKSLKVEVGINVEGGILWKKSKQACSSIRDFRISTLISLITVEVGINVEGVQKLQNQ